MLHLFANIRSARLDYITEVIFNRIIPTPYCWIDSNALEQKSQIPLLYYGTTCSSNAFTIAPHTLLFEENIYKQSIEIQNFENIPVFFTTSKHSDIPFDIFATTFYLISRYEEYLPFSPDSHGRFTAKHSLAFQHQFLDKPIVHIWCNILKNKLLEKFPNLVFKETKFRQINTFDIDVAYSYRGKPFFRRLGAFSKDVVQLNFNGLREKFQFLISKNDPYNTYDYLIKQTENTERIFFFQMGKYGKYDKNIPLNSHLKQLIVRLSKFGKIAIHPSYRSNENYAELQREITVLEQITNYKITFSRQHFLKLSLPETYENLIANGITTDFTMGYADHIGFRAGITVQYPFFNLTTNTVRPLEIIPFQIMDGTLNEYLHLTPDEAILKVKNIKNVIQSFGGIMVCIFHNSSLSETLHWKGWRKVFEQIATPHQI